MGIGVCAVQRQLCDLRPCLAFIRGTVDILAGNCQIGAVMQRNVGFANIGIIKFGGCLKQLTLIAGDQTQGVLHQQISAVSQFDHTGILELRIGNSVIQRIFQNAVLHMALSANHCQIHIVDDHIAALREDTHAPGHDLSACIRGNNGRSGIAHEERQLLVNHIQPQIVPCARLHLGSAGSGVSDSFFKVPTVSDFNEPLLQGEIVACLDIGLVIVIAGGQTNQRIVPHFCDLDLNSIVHVLIEHMEPAVRIVVRGAVCIAVDQIGAVQHDLPIVLAVVLDPVAGALARGLIFEIIGIFAGLQIGIVLISGAFRIQLNAADNQIIVLRPAFRADKSKCAGSQRVGGIFILNPQHIIDVAANDTVHISYSHVDPLPGLPEVFVFPLTGNTGSGLNQVNAVTVQTGCGILFRGLIAEVEAVLIAAIGMEVKTHPNIAVDDLNIHTDAVYFKIAVIQTVRGSQTGSTDRIIHRVLQHHTVFHIPVTNVTVTGEGGIGIILLSRSRGIKTVLKHNLRTHQFRINQEFDLLTGLCQLILDLIGDSCLFRYSQIIVEVLKGIDCSLVILSQGIHIQCGNILNQLCNGCGSVNDLVLDLCCLVQIADGKGLIPQSIHIIIVTDQCVHWEILNITIEELSLQIQILNVRSSAHGYLDNTVIGHQIICQFLLDTVSVCVLHDGDRNDCIYLCDLQILHLCAGIKDQSANAGSDGSRILIRKDHLIVDPAFYGIAVHLQLQLIGSVRKNHQALCVKLCGSCSL